MGIRFKFNLVILAVFLAGFLVSGYISYRLLQILATYIDNEKERADFLQSELKP